MDDTRLDIAELEYPSLANTCEAPADHPLQTLPATLGGRACLARAITEVVAQEFEELEDAWGIGANPDERRSTKHMVRSCLLKVARNWEAKCVRRVLLHPLAVPAPEQEAEGREEDSSIATAEEARLRAHLERLTAEAAVEDARLASLQGLEADLEERRRQQPAGDKGGVAAAACRDLSELIAKLAAEVGDGGEDAARQRGLAQAAGEVGKFLDRPALVEGHLNKTLHKLEDMWQDLELRELSIARQGVAHSAHAKPALYGL